MKTAWAHLPNAIHIDHVLASIKDNPDEWVKVYNDTHSSGGPLWMLAYDQTADEIRKHRSLIWEQAWGDVEQGPSKPWEVAMDTIIALIAYDDCGYMLDSEPGELAILAAFGDPKAILLLPACKMFAKEKELV